jgi:hypothetical protein
MRGIGDQPVNKGLKNATRSAFGARFQRGQFAAQCLNFFF